MPEPTKTAIYVRQSLDREEGIERQLTRCRAMLAAQEFTEVGVYIDNDTSASKPRGEKTDWARMVADIRAGKIDVIMAVAQDRIVRQTEDLEVLKKLKSKFWTVNGPLDLATANGALQAGITTVVASYEVQLKGERQQRANEHRAMKGERKSPRRAFGYEMNNELRPDEAIALRAAYEKFLGGASLGSIARELNAAGIPTAAPGVGERKGMPTAWRATNLRKVLLNPRNAALMQYRGKIVGPANWPAIVDADMFEATAARLNDPSRIRGSRAESLLLSGIARCGVCGGKLESGGRRNGDRRVYRCAAAQGHVLRTAAHLEEYVVEMVLAALEEQRARIEPLDEEGDLNQLLIRAGLLRQRQVDLSDDYYANIDGIMTREQYQSATRRIVAQLSEVNTQIAALSTELIVEPLLAEDDLTEAFELLSLEDRRRVITATVEVTVLPDKGGRGFRRENVRIEPIAA